MFIEQKMLKFRAMVAHMHCAVEVQSWENKQTKQKTMTSVFYSVSVVSLFSLNQKKKKGSQHKYMNTNFARHLNPNYLRYVLYMNAIS